MPHDPIIGAVIAGGRSVRFGSDKAAACLAGVRLIDHVIERLSVQVDQLVVCGRTEAGYTCLDDRPESGMGPLAGLAAALRHAAQDGFGGVLTSACDTPLVPLNLAQRLVGDAPAIVAGQPLFGYWPAHLSAGLDQFLLDPGNRAVGKWAELAGARRIILDAECPNINTRADLEQLRRRVAA